MRSLDLFSCVGNHALGFARAGIETAAFCEINPWRRERLAEQFPTTPIYEDVITFDGIPADIIFGGPPCQGTSVSAAIHGNRDNRSLWDHMVRIAIQWKPEWVVVEQPPGNAPWEAKVTRGLSRAGYHVARLEFGANDVGAPYIRRRVFLVASTSLSRLEIAWRAVPSEIERVKRAANARGDWDPASIPAFGVDAWRAEGVHDRRERIEALGDSNPPHMAEVIGRAVMFSIANDV